MIHWWNNLGIKGKFYFWGIFGLAVNLFTFFLNFWFPYMLAGAIALLVVGFLLPGDMDI